MPTRYNGIHKHQLFHWIGRHIDYPGGGTTERGGTAKRGSVFEIIKGSGTVTTLAGVVLKLPRYVRAKVDASWHDCADVLKLAEELIGMDRAGRSQIGCIGPERADLIVPGCAIFTAIHDVWPCTRLRVADRGLREGILRELMAEARR